MQFLLPTLARFVDGSFTGSWSSTMTISGELVPVLFDALGLVSVPRFPSWLVNSGANLCVGGIDSWHPLSK
jgi:hypothetical protein